MKLYYAKGACSIGIHVLLEEIGKPYDVQAVSFADQEQYGDAYKAINPKSKVPTLERNDKSILTEFPAIALYLASTAPNKKLAPTDADGLARCLEVMDYVIATIHMQGFARLFRPGNFGPDEAQHEQVKTRGRDIVEKGFALLDKKLSGKNYLLGEFSIADAALFYVEFWAVRVMKLPLPANCQRHFETMLARPAVKAALAAEGLS
jgi:glutathione S-transferase